MLRNHKLLSLLGLALSVVAIFISRCHPADEALPYQQLTGTVFHTVYHITYQDTVDRHNDIRRLFNEFDGSLSMFNDTSILTRMNRGDTSVVANHYVRTVIEEALRVSRATDGAFDITVAPFVNLWGFGFKNSERVTQAMIDSLMPTVGYEGISLDSEGHLLKRDPRTILDASSIAKGYMCDVVADYLRQAGVHNFMVEIGGEIALNGHNPHGLAWGVGINRPDEDSLQTNNELQQVLYLTGGALATSGNYRNFYYKDGHRYAHTIDPHTGYPIQQDILSSTVIAPTCITADAYATAFMVLGSERALQVLERDTTLMAYFITEDTIIYSPRLEALLRR